MPEPCKPHIMTMQGGRLAVASRAASPPMRAVSSSLTILMTICAGVRLSSTWEPMARWVTLLVKSLATL